MAAKSCSAENAGPSTPPPSISMSDKLLSSVFSLPVNPHIIYSVYKPSSSQHHECIELARRQVFGRNGSLSVLDSLLPGVHINKDDSALYIFAVTSNDRIGEHRSTLNALHFDGLTAVETSSFTPKDLYPCSVTCSIEHNPDPVCLNPQPSFVIPTPNATQSSFPSPAPSGACFLPRKPLRLVYSHFLEAVCSRLIDDISEASKRNPHARPVKRYKGGFLLGPPRSSSEWGTGWEHHAQTRPLTHCHLEVYLTPSRIIVHPILRPTHFIPLPLALPQPPGTPISLLPHGTPAYFLALYSGPTSALTAQFELSLTGLGSGEWKTTPPPYELSAKVDADIPSGSSQKYPMYVIVWISVQNKQGEDKGMVAIWPARLCASYLPSSASRHARQPLSYIPELPSQLQPSPPPHLPLSAISAPSTSLDDATSPASPIGQPLPSSVRPGTRRACTSPTSESLRAFRTLTLSKSRDINKVATEVGGYVDSIAKERERERERIRKERESGLASASPRTTSTPGIAGPTVSVATPAPASTTPTAIQSDAQPGQSPAITSSLSNQLPTASSAIPQPSGVSSQHFYPSPPQSNPPSSAPPVNTASQNAQPATSAEQPVDSDATAPSAVAPPSEPSQPSYDPFGNLDSAWSQPTNDFVGIDYNMDFGMNVDPIGGGGNGGGTSDRMGMDYDDFGAFTDDDFSFFDRPSAAARVTGPPLMAHSLSLGSGLTPASGSASLGLSPPIFTDGVHHQGPGPPSTLSGLHQTSPWTLAEGFSPRVHFSDDISPVPQLLPPSPTKTPSSHSAPATPNVQLSSDYDSSGRRLSSNLGVHAFDPIPFAHSHKVADGKYAVGKFALPSPPDEEDRTEPIPLASSPPQNLNGWRFKYNAVTDYRVGVVRKLIGVKRKSFDQGSRGVKMSPSWIREHEDWSSCVVEDAEDGKSEAESEEEVEEDDVPMISRPSTPLPSYLPMGPSLLHTHFHHSRLLPLSSPLRPPGAAVAPTNIAAAAPAVSVPTPVSPAAVLGAASEKSKSLEAAAYTVAKEVVENSVWAEAWRSNSVGSLTRRSRLEIWPNDVSSVAQLLADVPALEGPLDMKALFELDYVPPAPSDRDDRPSLETFEPPMFSVAKADAIIQVLPSALRFWEKLGLGPRAGKKDITAFAFFEDDGDERHRQVETWLTNLSTLYTSKHLGVHTPGTCSVCPRDGLVPLRFDSFRKTLASFVSSLPVPQSSLVFYIITPVTAMTLASPLLRQVFSAVKRALKTYSEAQILFQFVPEYLVTGSMESPTARRPDNELICYSVYDRVLQPVDRLMSRRFFEHGERIRNYFQDPVFTIARPLYNTVKYTQQSPVRSLDVMDRHTLLHVAYHVSSCGKWILAACVDQRGEAHDFGVWLTQSDSNETFIVTQVWNFAIQFAKKANVEWRIVFAKLGPMNANELDTWMAHLAAAVPTCYELPMMQVTLLSVDPDAPWTFMASQSGTKPSTPRTKSSPKDASGAVFVDASAMTYALYPSARITLAPPAPCDATDPTFVPDVDDTPFCEKLNISPLSSTILVRVPVDTGHTSISMLCIHLLHTIKSPNSSLTIPDAETHRDITHNFHELAILAEARWHLGANPLLPFHLAAVEVMHMALDPGDSLE